MNPDDQPNVSRSISEAHKSEEPVINHVAVRLPACWRDNIALWFAQAEAQFTNSRVKDDFTKYNFIVAALDPVSLRCVSDIVINPPAKDKYILLKTTLINRLQDSEDKRLTQLLTGLQLEDRKPTELLRHMQELAGPTLTESAIVKTLWLQRLPQHVQAILSALPVDQLPQLASAADKIVEVYQPAECGAVDRRNQPGPSKPEDSSNSILIQLQKQIASLTDELRQLKMERNNTPTHSYAFHEQRSYKPRRNWQQNTSSQKLPAGRNRSNSRGRSPRRASTGTCIYHTRYGDNAHRCIKPCNFVSKPSGNDRGSSQ